jgi:hypothetical protein
MSDLVLSARHRQTGLAQFLVVFAQCAADERALDTALKLARCTDATFRALLAVPEFRHYTTSVNEFQRLRNEHEGRVAKHAFRLCDRALDHGYHLPVELVTDARRWIREWINARPFGLIVVAHEHHPLGEYLPSTLVARLRRDARYPVIVVK